MLCENQLLYQAAIMITSLFSKTGERNTSMRPSRFTYEFFVFSLRAVLEISASFTTYILFTLIKIFLKCVFYCLALIH
jgi:hypothetical protein